MKRYSPLWELFLARMRGFYREPEAMFWTYGFPVILTVGLGIAFRNKPVEIVDVAVEESIVTADVVEVLKADDAFDVDVGTRSECEDWVRRGNVALAVLTPSDSASDELTDGEGTATKLHDDSNRPADYEFRFDPTRPEATLARLKLNDSLQRAAGRSDVVRISAAHMTAPGARYVDFVVPGLLGMNLMGAGLWGVGFLTVDMRIRKLLKRLVASPMRKRDFMLSVLGARLAFTLPEVAVLLLCSWLIFQIVIEGSVLAIAAVSIVGSMSFAGIGLLAASRAKKLESISGLMNVIMLPMWMLSGIFFSSSRFPDVMQPFIQALPLTQLNNALRAVITDGATLASQWLPLAVLAVYGVVSFVLALKWFRWT